MLAYNACQSVLQQRCFCGTGGVLRASNFPMLRFLVSWFRRSLESEARFVYVVIEQSRFLFLFPPLSLLNDYAAFYSLLDEFHCRGCALQAHCPLFIPT